MTRPKSGVTMVDWGKGNTSSEKGLLYTEGLSCCIGVGIYNKLSTIGYLAHLMPTVISNTSVLTPMLKMVDDENGDFAQLVAWVRGGILPTPNHHTYDLRRSLRSKTVTQLAMIRGLELDVQWNDNPYMVVDMALPCATGNFIATNSYSQNNSALHSINDPVH